jgi:tetratricopeptide (TPR) repeat protein
MIQHLAHAAGFAREDTSLSQLEKLEAQLAIAGIETDQDLSLVASLVGIRSADRYPPINMPPPVQLQMTKDALRRYFMGLASRPSAMAGITPSSRPGDGEPTPLLLIVEDLHWIDPTSLELIDQILAGPQTVPILLLMTTRPELKPNFTTEPKIIRLGRLDEQASRAIATHVAAEIALSASAIDTIIQRSDGVPLYIEEMTRMVMDSHGIRARGAEMRQTDIPDTLIDLLMERLDRLGPGKWLAQVGSVIGHEFGRRLLYTAADMDRIAFDEALSAMLGASLVLPVDSTGERFAFKHALIEDAAYGSIIPKTRIMLHGRLADVLMSEFAEAIERQPELAARHLSRAHRHLEASRYFLQAGRQALGRGAPREAAAHLSDGVAILSGVPPGRERSESELALLSVLGPTTMVLRGPGSQAFRDVQRRALALCHELPGAPRQFSITYGLCLYHWGRAELETARGLAEDLLKVAESRGDDAEAVIAANNMNGMIKLSLGDAQAARTHLERSVARYDPQRDAALYPVYLMDFGVFGRFYLALATLITGDEERASQHAQDAYELAGRLNQPHTLGFSMLAICTVALLRDQPTVARQFAEQCIEFSSQMGFSEFVGMARIARGWATARHGQLAVGLDDMEAGIRLWQATGFENWQSWFGSLRAELLAELGRSEEALRGIELQLYRINRSGENLFRSLLLAQKATLLSTDPATAETVEQLLEEATETALAQHAVAWIRRIETMRTAIRGAAMKRMSERRDGHCKKLEEGSRILPIE